MEYDWRTAPDSPTSPSAPALKPMLLYLSEQPVMRVSYRLRGTARVWRFSIVRPGRTSIQDTQEFISKSACMRAAQSWFEVYKQDFRDGKYGHDFGNGVNVRKRGRPRKHPI